MSAAPHSAGWTPQDLHGGEDDEELEEEFEPSRDAVVFAIDAAGHMLDPLPAPAPDGSDGDDVAKPAAASSMLSALRAILKLMKLKIIRNPKDMVGIVVFNTRERRGIGGEYFENTVILQDTLELDAPMVQALRNLISEAEEDPSTLTDLLAPHSGVSVMDQAISTCNQILRSRAHTLASKRICLVTDVEDPYPLDGGARFGAQYDANLMRTRAHTLARDCAEQHFSITPFFIKRDSSPFDVMRFYKDILVHHVALDEDEAAKYTIREGTGDGLGWDHFLETTSIRPPPKRAAFTIPFILADGLKITVNGFNMISEAKKSAAVKVDLSGANPREVGPKTVFLDESTGQPLDAKKGQIRSYVPMGGSKDEETQPKKIVFEDDERDELRSVGQSPGLRLLGFIDPDTIPVEHFVRHALFIYPTDKAFIGSTRLFASLLQVMLEKRVAGVALLVSRKNSTPQHVMILPQEEERNDDDVQTRPPGMHLIQLAYADDIRAVPDAIRRSGTLPATRNADPDAEHPDFDLCKKIMNKLRFKNGYLPESYDNPALHYHYAMLEALALQEDAPEPQDATVPHYHSIRDRVGDSLRKLRDLIDSNPESHFTTGKRAKTADGKAVVSSKKRALAETGDAPEEADVVKLFRSGDGGKLKKDEMMAYLDSVNQGYKKSSTKPVLAQAIEDYLTEKGLIS